MRRFGIMTLFFLMACGQGQGFVSAILDTPISLGQTPGLGTAGFMGRSVVRDSRGWVWAVHIQSSGLVRCSRSTDNGRTWVWIADVSTEPADLPNIGVGRGDTLQVVWVRMQLDTLGMDVFWSRYDGTSWSPPFNVSNRHYQNNDMFVSMALDTLGHPHVVWRGGGVWYSYYDGAAWSPPEMVTSSAWFLSLCSDKRNRLHLTYQGWAYYRCRENGIWGPEERAPGILGQPTIAVDSLNRPYIAGGGVGVGGKSDIIYTFRDSTGWRDSLNVSNTVGASRYPSISFDRKDNIYLLWCDSPTLDTLTYDSNLWWGRYDGVQWQVDSLRYDTLILDWEPSVGFPVSDSGVDVVWTQGPLSGPYRVMYWRLPLLPVGVEGEGQKTLKVESFKLDVQSPARQVLKVRYALPVQSRVSLVLYDIAGRKVASIEDGEKPAGKYEDKYPLSFPSGVYFLRLEAGKVDLTRKVVVIR